MTSQDDSVLPTDLPLDEERPAFDAHFPQMKNNVPRRYRYSSPLILIFGFLVCISLLVGFMSYGTVKLDQSQQRVDALVAELASKISLVNTMRNNARERTVSLYAMVSAPDPFEQDEVFLSFNAYGFEFLVARKKLLSMNLDSTEKQLLEKQNLLTGIVVPVQDEVVDLVKNDEIEAASELLNSKVTPLQKNTLQALIDLQQYQQQLSDEMTMVNAQKQTEMKRFIFILGAIGTFLSVIVAIYVVRHINRIERKSHLEKELAELTLHSIDDAVITTCKESVITSMNPRAEQLTGWQESEAIGEPLKNVFKIFDQDSTIPIADPTVKALNLGRTIKSNENQLLLSLRGLHYAIGHTVSPVYDINNQQLGAVIVFRDETETRALSTQLQYQASHEIITGLMNRRAFESKLEACFRNYSGGNNGYVMSLLLIEQFQLINDTCGHLACNELLRQLAKLLKQNMPDNDTLARLGSGEFGLLFSDCDIKQAQHNAQRLLHAVEQFRFTWKGQSFDVAANMGITPIGSLTANLSELFDAADSACYLAKNSGRNCAYVYQPNDRELERHRGEMLWIQQINKALEDDGFILYFQPIHALSDKATGVDHYEILLRMKDEAGNIIPPMAFIPAAERSHLMPKIDRWVIEHALSRIKEILAEEQVIKNKHLFSINISGQAISDTTSQDLILAAIADAQLPVGVLCIEVTETAAITNLSSAVGFIKRLRLAGCRFALDDFGSSLSLFSYLKNMTIDYIKIDDGFIRDICNDVTDRVFVESVIQICRIMNIKTVAECVENRHIYEEIKRIGVNYAQGYYIANPMPLVEFSVEPQQTRPVSA